jgi:hypothetical protein
MTNYRENLIDRLIAVYGFENPIVIGFAEWCETWTDNTWNDKVLTIFVDANEAHPVLEED